MVTRQDHHQWVYSRKDDLLKHVRKALVDAGLDDFEVQSIHLNVKHVHR